MAVVAFGTESTVMLIVLLVTLDARRWRITKRGGQVAFLAFDPDMASGQRKAGLAMVERHSGPFVLAVAGFAAHAELSAMLVILAMA